MSRKKDGHAAERLKKSDLSCKSMKLVLKPVHYFYFRKFIEYFTNMLSYKRNE